MCSTPLLQQLKMKETIEEFFIKQAVPHDFPNHVDYVAIYKSFRNFMNQEIHKEIKTMTSRFNPNVYLNDHSAEHVQMVIEKISSILRETGFDYLSKYEIFILLIAAHIHDAGHIFQGRSGHEKTGKKFLSELPKYISSSIERITIQKIAQAHSGKEDPIGALEANMRISGEEIRTRMLAALIRLGDELADGKSRSSNYLLDNGLIPMDSQLFHAFSSCLDTFEPITESHEIEMTFCLNKNYVNVTYSKPSDNGKTENIFLVDEIYARTMKTFCECLYYNRFVPEKLRLTTVSVKIHFIDEEKLEEFFEPISFRIKEIGYPQLMSNDIFELCNHDLQRNGIKLTGEYIMSSIKQAHESI